MAGAGTDPAPLVLVVEDAPDVADLLELSLESNGYRVRTARDGAEGLTEARRAAPDLILLDVMMPVLDGWQTLRALKEEEELRDIPVVMLSALGEESDVIRGSLGGAIEYVTKPFEVAELLAVVERSLVEPDQAERTRRRRRAVRLLRRLAELDSGRSGAGPGPRWDRLESRPTPEVTAPAAELDVALVDKLTRKQRYVAEQMARGRSARELAEELDVSRSNIYATRKRIARKLGVDPEEVADAAHRLGLAETDVGSPDGPGA